MTSFSIILSVQTAQGALEFGPFFRPNVATTLTKRLLYCILLLALPVFFLFFS